jgi:hypothetical protein
VWDPKQLSKQRIKSEISGEGGGEFWQQTHDKEKIVGGVDKSNQVDIRSSN